MVKIEPQHLRALELCADSAGALNYPKEFRQMATQAIINFYKQCENVRTAIKELEIFMDLHDKLMTSTASKAYLSTLQDDSISGTSKVGQPLTPMKSGATD